MVTDSFDLHTSLELVSGLRPKVWLCVGAGYAREDIKALILSQGRGFVADAVITPQELCLKILGIPGDRVLSTFARQEVLRLFLNEKRIMDKLAEMKKLRRQKNFFRRLDLALQSGRLAFAHAQEEEVYSERLTQVLGENSLRGEIHAFAGAFEAWMEASNWWDLPMLLKKATSVLHASGWPADIAGAHPEQIWYCAIQTPESLEKEFWEALSRDVPVHRTSASGGSRQLQFEWQKHHTLDDAAEYIADRLAFESPVALNQHAILIPDHPAVRRSLRRALEMRGIPLAEPRDPTHLKWDESIKWAILPLQVVGRSFERQKVIAWLRYWQGAAATGSAEVNEVNARGIRFGLASYAGGALADTHALLTQLSETLGGRKTCAEIAKQHVQLLNSRPQLAEFFEQIWKDFATDMERIGQAERRAPLLYWLERLEKRLDETAPPIDALKPQFGVRLYRLQQAPILPAEKIWLFGIPPRWLAGEGTGDFWFSERDREILAPEFAIRSWMHVREERLKILQFWLDTTKHCTLLDADFDSSGRERESLYPFIKELKLSLNCDVSEPSIQGAHPRTAASYQASRPSQPTRIELPPLTGSVTGSARGARVELTATLLDRSSRCSFQALAYHRWNLRDIREPETELWPDVRGNILHEAVRILVKSSKPGNPTVSPRDALSLAWQNKRPRGLIRSKRVENYVRTRLEKIIDVFCEKESEFAKKAKTLPMSLDEMTLRLEYPQFAIRGQPDRIDQNEQGIFIMDYKSSGAVPHGIDMIENGYRLQLPFYAIAAGKQLNQDVLGVQFVELDKKGGRKSGILFKEFNGKEEGKLSQLRSNSKSLISQERGEVWTVLEEHLIATAEAYVEGRFEALPRTVVPEKECAMCSVSDLCGFKRRTDVSL